MYSYLFRLLVERNKVGGECVLDSLTVLVHYFIQSNNFQLGNEKLAPGPFVAKLRAIVDMRFFSPKMVRGHG